MFTNDDWFSLPFVVLDAFCGSIHINRTKATTAVGPTSNAENSLTFPFGAAAAGPWKSDI